MDQHTTHHQRALTQCTARIREAERLFAAADCKSWRDALTPLLMPGMNVHAFQLFPLNGVIKGSVLVNETLVVWFMDEPTEAIFRATFREFAPGDWRFVAFEINCCVCFGDTGYLGSVCPFCYGTGYDNHADTAASAELMRSLRDKARAIRTAPGECKSTSSSEAG